MLTIKVHCFVLASAELTGVDAACKFEFELATLGVALPDRAKYVECERGDLVTDGSLLNLAGGLCGE